MLGFSRVQILFLIGAAFSVALSASVQHVVGSLAPPLTLVRAEAHNPQAAPEPPPESPAALEQPAAPERLTAIELPTTPEPRASHEPPPDSQASPEPAGTEPEASEGSIDRSELAAAQTTPSSDPGNCDDSVPEASRDLNRMGRDEILALPGVGPVIADRILAYRSDHGGFERLEELMEIKGIGEVKYRRLLPLLSVGPKDTKDGDASGRDCSARPASAGITP